MALLQFVLLLGLAALLLLADYRSLATGWLPCGCKSPLTRLEIRRDERPLAYWLLFALYLLGALALTGTAFGILTGLLEPLPLR